MNPFNQYNETDRLRKVIIGRYDTYSRVPEYIERVNPEQEKGLPDINQLRREMENFRIALIKEHVDVLTPEPVGKFVYDQLTPRDIGVTIGNRFLLCNMTKKSRRYEAAGIFSYLNQQVEKEPNVLVPDSPAALMEGGDIVVDKGMIFVAQTERTNKEGIDYVTRNFGKEFNVIPIQTQSKKKGENILHLDCIFLPVGEKHALIYENGFKDIPLEIRGNYELIPINHNEQQALVTNVLSLSKKKVISRKHETAKRVNAVMMKKGIEVIELPFDAAPSTGGSFRCCTLPLERESREIN